LSIVLVVSFEMNWEGRLIAQIISVIVFSLISIVFIIKRGFLTLKPSKKYLKECAWFGIPLIPHSLAGWFMTGADRLIILSIVGMSELGIYTVYYQIGMILSIIATAFNKAWAPYLFDVLKNRPPEYKSKLVRITYIYFLAIVILAVTGNYLIDLFLPYFLGDGFISTFSLLGYLIAASAFQGMYFMVTNYIFFVKRTSILANITFSISAVHVITSYILVSLNGIVGAAQATTITFLLMFVITWFFSNRLYPMPWGRFS